MKQITSINNQCPLCGSEDTIVISRDEMDKILWYEAKMDYEAKQVILNRLFGSESLNANEA